MIQVEEYGVCSHLAVSLKITSSKTKSNKSDCPGRLDEFKLEDNAITSQGSIREFLTVFIVSVRSTARAKTPNLCPS
jgi:hypothetical protein